jgi:hypothetical protein
MDPDRPLMRFTRYPKAEPYQITPRKLPAAHGAVQAQKDRYPLFPELLTHQTAEERLAAVAINREQWWQQVRDRRAQLWRRARQALRNLPPGHAPLSSVTGRSAPLPEIPSICSP